MTRSDSELLDAARASDAKAFGILWSRHLAVAIHVARANTTRVDPEDVVSEAFSRVWATLQIGKGPTTQFRPYLLAVVSNVARTWGKRLAREIPVPELPELEFEWSAGDHELIEHRALLREALAGVPDRSRAMLWMQWVEGRPVSEIAQVFGMSSEAVAAATYRARSTLRARLTDPTGLRDSGAGQRVGPAPTLEQRGIAKQFRGDRWNAGLKAIQERVDDTLTFVVAE